jgi:hypothetical protein
VGLSSGVTQIVAGDAYSCALTTAGQVKCWGDNQFGQLGNGSTTDALVPVDVAGASGATGLTAGGLHACAIRAVGTVSCWGRNNFGQLGDGTTTDRLLPVNVAELPEEATEITAGVLHTCALGAPSGAVRCWGSNTYGQLGGALPGTSTTPVAVTRLTGGATAIAAGDGHTCALTESGAVTCWGYNGYGQLGDGSTTTTFRGMPVTTVDFTVHPKIVNLSVLGSAVTNPYSAPTKVTRVAAAVTWRAQTLPARPGESLEVWMATKPGNSFTWTGFSHVADVTLDPDGYAFFTYRSPIAQWVSVRFILPAHGGDPTLTSFARQAQYR